MCQPQQITSTAYLPLNRLLGISAVCCSSWLNASFLPADWAQKAAVEWSVRNLECKCCLWEQECVCTVERLHLTSRPRLTALSLYLAWRNSDRIKRRVLSVIFRGRFVLFSAWWSWLWWWVSPCCSARCSFSSVSVSARSVPTHKYPSAKSGNICKKPCILFHWICLDVNKTKSGLSCYW